MSLSHWQLLQQERSCSWQHYRKVWAKKGQEMLTWQWGCDAVWAGPGIISSCRVIWKPSSWGVAVRDAGINLGQDFDASLGVNGYPGPALAVGAETLECSLTEQWVGVQCQSQRHYFVQRSTKWGRNLCKMQSFCLREQPYLLHE